MSLSDNLKIRDALIRENEAIQRAWDKEFNSKVLDIVRKAIHRGLVQVMIYEKLNFPDYADPNKTIGDKPIRTMEIRYDKYRKDAYQNVREQAEKAVRMNMPPPKLFTTLPLRSNFRIGSKSESRHSLPNDFLSVAVQRTMAQRCKPSGSI